MATGNPYVAAYDCAIRSAHDLLTSYGWRPCSGASSVYGRTSWSPYALSDEAKTIWFTVGVRRHASSREYVPRIFESNVEVGFRFATPTTVWAARWNTVSISYSP